MPITSHRSDLSRDQRQQLIALITEASNRGLPVAEELRKFQQSKIRKWATDENGYFSRRDGHIYKPYEEQENFVKSKSRFSLFIGGRGSGKSASGAQKSLAKIKQGYNGAVFNPHFENFKTSTWIEFRDWIPWDYVIVDHKYRQDTSWQPQKPFILKFENGATVQCKGLKDESSARGPNINWLWYDEAQDDEDGLGWTTAIASVRVGESPQAWCTATGRGTYHWMYEFFVEQRFPEEVLQVIEDLAAETGSDIPFIDWYHGSIFDNKDNVDPGFMAAILTANPVGYRNKQEVYGEFADPGGNLGDPSWFKDRILEEPPKNAKNRVRYWDLAASEKKIAGPSNKKLTDPDSTAGTLLSHFIDENISGQAKNQFAIEHQISGQWKWERIKSEIIRIAKEDGATVPIYIEEEPGSGGH